MGGTLPLAPSSKLKLLRRLFLSPPHTSSRPQLQPRVQVFSARVFSSSFWPPPASGPLWPSLLLASFDCATGLEVFPRVSSLSSARVRFPRSVHYFRASAPVPIALPTILRPWGCESLGWLAKLAPLATGGNVGCSST